MEGVLGHRAWRWLFYIEGAASELESPFLPFLRKLTLSTVHSDRDCHYIRFHPSGQTTHTRLCVISKAHQKFQDFPENSQRWLTDEERTLAINRMVRETGQADVDSEEVSAFQGFKEAMTDYKVWLLALMMAGQQLGQG
jgi:hypothetical protein